MTKPESVRNHPIAKKCMDHLHVLGTDPKTRQIVYMYMERLCRETGSDKE